MDADGRFVVGSDEFIELVGPKTTAAFGRTWSEIAAELKLDPDNQIARAVASHETWSGIVIPWPVDETSDRLPVELSGLPVFDRDRSFRGYRGFGVCRDLARINQLARARRERPIGFMPSPETDDTAPSATAKPCGRRSGNAARASRAEYRAGCGQCGAVSSGAARGTESADAQPGGAQGVPRTGAGTDRALARSAGGARRRRARCRKRGGRSAESAGPSRRIRSLTVLIRGAAVT